MSELKEILISQIKKDLKSGLTRWKKDNLGFGSLEEKYSLTFTEVKELIEHPKIQGIKTKIPTLRIIDDTENTSDDLSPAGEDFEEAPIKSEVINTTIEVVENKEQKKYTPAF